MAQSLILVAAILIVVSSYILYKIAQEYFSKLPPSVYPIWRIISLIKWIKTFNNDTMKALQIATKLRGDTFRMNFIFRELYITFDPSLINKFVNEWDKLLDFYKPTTMNIKLIINVRNSVIPYKPRIRKILMNKQQIENWSYNQFSTECDEYFSKNKINFGDTLNLTKQINHLLFRCLLKSLIGSKCILNKSHQFQNNFYFLLKHFLNPWVQKLPKWWPYGIRAKYTKIHNWFENILIESYKELNDDDNNNDNNNSYLKSFINVPLFGQSRDTKHLFAMLYGATVNTIPTITIATIILSLNENKLILNQLHSYLKSIDIDKNLENYDFWKFDFLDKIITEILRLYPVRLITRITKQNINIKDKNILIPKNKWFVISPYYHHRNKSIYDNPDSFNPNRWKSAKQVREFKKSGKYINFGFGSHSCIGARYATILFKTFLIKFFSNYTINLSINNPSYHIEYYSKKRGFKHDIFGSIQALNI